MVNAQDTDGPHPAGPAEQGGRTALPLPHEMLFLTRDPDTGAHPLGLDDGKIAVVAALSEAVLTGRLAVVDGQVELRDPAPTGSAVPDRLIAQVAEAGRPVPIGAAVGALGWRTNRELLPERVVRDELIRRALVLPEPGGVLHDRYRPAGRDLRDRLVGAIGATLDAGSGDARAVERVGLLAVFRMLGRVLDRPTDVRLRRRAKEIRGASVVGSLVAPVLMQQELL